jgi:LmbE family N-acetylglucosaminyl deacetylase
VLVDPQPPDSLLVTMAHPDDLEYSAAGTVARWSRSGTSVVLCLASDGEHGTDDRDADLASVRRVRRAEASAAAALLGCADVVFLGVPDGTLSPDRSLCLRLARLVRRLRPEALLCPDPTWRFDDTYVNHPDHVAVGEAALRVADPGARNWHAFPELAAEELVPHAVSTVYLASPNRENCVVDIESTLEIKVAALRAHASQVAGVPVADLLAREAATVGARHGLRRAESFCRIDLR